MKSKKIFITGGAGFLGKNINILFRFLTYSYINYENFSFGSYGCKIFDLSKSKCY